MGFVTDRQTASEGCHELDYKVIKLQYRPKPQKAAAAKPQINVGLSSKMMEDAN